jgi:hypothetical protein
LSLKILYNYCLNINVPILTVHFEGADVLLMLIHTFPAQNGITCFEVYPSNNNGDGFELYGNFAQSNFLVGYDMEKMMVSFKPTDCTKYYGLSVSCWRCQIIMKWKVFVLFQKLLKKKSLTLENAWNILMLEITPSLACECFLGLNYVQVWFWILFSLDTSV